MAEPLNLDTDLEWKLCVGESIMAYNISSYEQIKPVQKQTRAGQRTRFKAIVVIGDSEGHVGLGIKTSKEVATAIRAAIIIAKLSVLPIRRGYWGTNLGDPHSLPTKESGKCGSVTVRVCLHLSAITLGQKANQYTS